MYIEGKKHGDSISASVSYQFFILNILLVLTLKILQL